MRPEDIPHEETENIMWSDLTTEEYEEAVGAENRYYTSQSLGRSPTDEEALNHYIKHSPKLHQRLTEEGGPTPIRKTDERKRAA